VCRQSWTTTDADGPFCLLRDAAGIGCVTVTISFESLTIAEVRRLIEEAGYRWADLVDTAA
jgi:hypothetical protein